MPYVGVALRFVAILADLVVTVPLFVVWAIAFGEKHSTSGNGTAGGTVFLSGIPFLTYLLVVIAYNVVCEALWGATLGKRLVGIRVVDEHCRNPSWGRAITRNLLRVIDILPLFYLVGAITVWATPQNQRVGDLAAKTFVIPRTAQLHSPA